MKKGWGFLLVLILATGISRAEDSEIEILRSKLASQEARLAAQNARLSDQDARMRDLELKMIGAKASKTGEVEGVTSLRKNALVTIGGFASPSYIGHNYKVSSTRGNDGNIDGAGYRKRADAKTGSYQLVEAEVQASFTIGENIDGWFALDINGLSNADGWWVAKEYWIRWKNICDSGFGIKVGRDTAAFGGIAYGYMDSFATLGDGVSWLGEGLFGSNPNVLGEAALGKNEFGAMPLHNYWLMKGVTQITPYWESKDGKFLWEVSLFQDVDVIGWNGNGGLANGQGPYTSHTGYRGDVLHHRSNNFGVSSMSTRITWMPVEGLRVIGGFMNLHKNGFADGYGLKDTDVELGKNNAATYLGFEWRPAFLSRLNVWGQWVHGWNVANIKDLDSDVFNLGAGWNLTDKFIIFAQGDYLCTKYDGTGRSGTSYDNKATAWASHCGVQYDFGNGLSLEAGWRHEEIKYKEWGKRNTKIKGDLYYASLLLSF